MTVNTIHPAELHAIRAAQLDWLEAEFNARAAFALVRLDHLQTIGPRLTAGDRFDAAYAIWDDYIDGRHADERDEKLIAPQLREQAMVFAKVAAYLPPADLFALAKAAWGLETFEVFLLDVDGNRTGRFGWYRGDQLSIVTIATDPCTPAGRILTHDFDVWTDEGRVYSDKRISTRKSLALHPVFGRVA